MNRLVLWFLGLGYLATQIRPVTQTDYVIAMLSLIMAVIFWKNRDLT